jgi:hypothetical protein
MYVDRPTSGCRAECTLRGGFGRKTTYEVQQLVDKWDNLILWRWNTSGKSFVICLITALGSVDKSSLIAFEGETQLPNFELQCWHANNNGFTVVDPPRPLNLYSQFLPTSWLNSVPYARHLSHYTLNILREGSCNQERENQSSVGIYLFIRSQLNMMIFFQMFKK